MQRNNNYTLYSSNGSLYIKEEAKNFTSDWVRLTQTDKSGLGKFFPSDAPRRSARQEWETVNAGDFDGAIKEFEKEGTILKARQYMIDLVLGLKNGWANSLILDYDRTGFEVIDFVPFQCLPLERKTFQFALIARSELVDELSELEQDFPLAEDWLSLIGEDTIYDIRTGIDQHELDIFGDSDIAKREAIREFKRYGAKTDYDEWTENYLNNSGEANYGSPKHYRHCARVFKAGVQAIEQAFISSRLHLLEAGITKEKETYEIA
jgi:hypothetical protein